MPSPDLWRWSALDTAAAIRAKKISAHEAVQASLQRMDAVNGKLNAVVQRFDAEALAAADAADAAQARGEALGPLHGVPVTIKVNADQKGHASTNGVVAFKDLIAKDDAPQVANWRKAGAVIIGRTNTPCFSWRFFTENELHGKTLNPWRKDITPGGSSGGASSAIAAGIGALAHGNDIGGSVRYPAYCVGVPGIRPSFGRVPSFNATAAEERPITGQLFSVQGPLARSIQDLRLGLSTMAMPDARDPWHVPAPTHYPPQPGPLKVALIDGSAIGRVDPDVAAALAKASAWLKEAGYIVDTPKTPDLWSAYELWRDLMANDAKGAMRESIEKFGDAQLKISAAPLFDGMNDLDHLGFRKALARRASVIREWNLFFQDWPLVLLPCSLAKPFPQDFDLDPANGTGLLRQQSVLELCPLTGFPGLNAPTHAAGRIPLGVQLIAPRFREDLLFDAGQAIEDRAGLLTPIDPAW